MTMIATIINPAPVKTAAPGLSPHRTMPPAAPTTLSAATITEAVVAETRACAITISRRAPSVDKTPR